MIELVHGDVCSRVLLVYFRYHFLYFFCFCLDFVSVVLLFPFLLTEIAPITHRILLYVHCYNVTKQ